MRHPLRIITIACAYRSYSTICIWINWWWQICPWIIHRVRVSGGVRVRVSGVRHYYNIIIYKNILFEIIYNSNFLKHKPIFTKMYLKQLQVSKNTIHNYLLVIFYCEIIFKIILLIFNCVKYRYNAASLIFETVLLDVRNKNEKCFG
jgi:hypothetical protein